MPRINRAIELIEQNHVVFCGGTPALTHAAGVAAAQTTLDVILVDFEHQPFDMAGLRAFIGGLIAAGPTRSGHRTPPVICTLPVIGASATAVEANAWQIAHLLAAGVHGLLLCHAETPAAVKKFVECCRYPFQKRGREVLDVGRRGGGGQGYAAEVWGLSVAEYMARCDPWPLNPNGELFLGLKVENRRALANVEASLTVPGIAYAEWGPGDMGMSLADDYFIDDAYTANPEFAHDPPYGPVMEAAQKRVLAACKSNGVAFYSTMREDWRELYAMGARMSSASPRTLPIIDAVRQHSGRTMPV